MDIRRTRDRTTRDAVEATGAPIVRIGDHSFAVVEGARIGKDRDFLLRVAGEDAIVWSVAPAGEGFAGVLAGMRVATAGARDFLSFLDEAMETARTSLWGERLGRQDFHVVHTGAGCLAWRRDVEEDGSDYVQIEDLDGLLRAEDGEDRWALGRYADGHAIRASGLTFSEASIMQKYLPRPTAERSADMRGYDELLEFEQEHAAAMAGPTP